MVLPRTRTSFRSFSHLCEKRARSALKSSSSKPVHQSRLALSVVAEVGLFRIVSQVCKKLSSRQLPNVGASESGSWWLIQIDLMDSHSCRKGVLVVTRVVAC